MKKIKIVDGVIRVFVVMTKYRYTSMLFYHGYYIAILRRHELVYNTFN